MNKLEQKRYDRKNKILAEAKKLILERGISDGIMSELAVRSGISRQRLYVYYSNVDAVLSDLMESVYTYSHLDDLRNTSYDNPAEVIRYSILLFPTISDEMHDDLLFLSLLSVYTATNRAANIRHGSGIVLFEKQIREGQAKGIFRSDHDVAYLSSIVTHMITGFLYHSETLSLNERGHLLNEEVLNLLADMVLSYLSKK